MYNFKLHVGVSDFQTKKALTLENQELTAGAKNMMCTWSGLSLRANKC